MTAATDLAAVFPERSDAFRDIALEVQAAVARLGSVLEHGDYWFGNLLLRSGRITGVVDWDSWAAGGVPGTDLLQLYSSTQRRTRRDLGDLLLARIWADAPFRKLSEPYWQALGIEPTEAERQAVAVAWWLGQMAAASRLGRVRLGASYPLWVRKNIDAVLEQLAASMRGIG